MARVEDIGSGLAEVKFVIDGEAIGAIYDRVKGLYVVEVRLGEGEHAWRVVAVDRVGYVGSSRTMYITVNMSFFGDPGWRDDILFFGPLALALILITAYVLLKRKEVLIPP